jgi:hypothetical protein
MADLPDWAKDTVSEPTSVLPDWAKDVKPEEESTLSKIGHRAKMSAEMVQALAKKGLEPFTGTKPSEYDIKPKEIIKGKEEFTRALKTGGLTAAANVAAPYAVELAGKIAPRIAPAPLKPAAQAFSMAAPEIATAMKATPGIARGLEGFTGGAAASLAGTEAQKAGLPQPVQTLAELSAGTSGVKGTQAFEWGLKKITNTHLAQTILKRVMPEVMPSQMVKSSIERAAETGVKQQLFGDVAPPIDLGKSPAQSQAFSEIQSQSGMTWDKTKYDRPSKQYLEETVKPIINAQRTLSSPEYSALQKSIDKMGAQALPTDKQLIADVLLEGNQQKIFSLAKHGRTLPKTDPYGRPINAPELSTEARKMFEETLINTTGGDRSPFLKYNDIFRKEKIAEASDAIPRMVTGDQATRMRPAEIKQYASNIATTDENKQAFATALNQYFREFKGNEQQMFQKMNELRPILEESKIMNAKQLDNVESKIASIPKSVSDLKRKLMINKIVTSALTSAVGAKVGEYKQEK